MSGEGQHLNALGPREIFAPSGRVRRFHRPAAGELRPFAQVPADALMRGAHRLAEPKRSAPERLRALLAAGCGAGIGSLAADKIISIDWNTEETLGQ